MSKIENGGTAFPCLTSDGLGDIGMTLRDYFAGQAIVGIISKGYLITPNMVAEHAYQIAEAMIEARSAE